METLSSYRLKVQNEVDDTSSTATRVIDEVIKETYAEICQEIAPIITGDIAEEVSVTSSVVTPTNVFEQITSVHYKSTDWWEKLPRITEKEFTDCYLNDNSSSPKAYLVRDDTIVLTGSPTSGTVRVQGTLVTPELTINSIIPDRFSRVVVLGSVYRFLGYEKDAAAENYKLWYEQAKRDMLQQLLTKASITRAPLR